MRASISSLYRSTTLTTALDSALTYTRSPLGVGTTALTGVAKSTPGEGLNSRFRRPTSPPAAAKYNRSPLAVLTPRVVGASTALSTSVVSGGRSRQTTVALLRSAATSSDPSGCGKISRAGAGGVNFQGRTSLGVRRVTAPPWTP